MVSLAEGKTVILLSRNLTKAYHLPKTNVIFWRTGVAFILGGILGGL